jgi:hypothetical protein
MNAKRLGWAGRLAAHCATLGLLLGSIAPALAWQGGEGEHGVCGWEVRSTNTPGGGGELTSQGVTGTATPWSIAEAAPTTAGTAVVNLVIRYYHCEECWKKAKEDKKKSEEEAKKKKEEEKKKKKKARDEKPPLGPDVPTFDPRTHELKDGKVVPKDPKDVKPGRLSQDPKDHQWCEMPQRFECGQHFLWWLENHNHRTEAPKAGDQKQGKVDTEKQPMSLQGTQPRIVLTDVVVPGQEATFSVVNIDGAALRGAVIELPNGESVKTDEHGQARIKVPNGIETLSLAIAGTQILQKAWVRDGKGVFNQPPSLPPVGSSAAFQRQLLLPAIIVPGQEAEVFTADATVVIGDTVQDSLLLDGRPVSTLSQSGAGWVVSIPKDLAPGTHWFSLVRNGKIVEMAPTDSIELKVDPPKTLAPNQRASYQVTILGTDRKLDLLLNNLSGGSADLIGKSAAGVVQSSGGRVNKATVELMSRMPGAILVDIRPRTAPALKVPILP